MDDNIPEQLVRIQLSFLFSTNEAGLGRFPRPGATCHHQGLSVGSSSAIRLIATKSYPTGQRPAMDDKNRLFYVNPQISRERGIFPKRLDSEEWSLTAK